MAGPKAETPGARARALAVLRVRGTAQAVALLPTAVAVVLVAGGSTGHIEGPGWHTARWVAIGVAALTLAVAVIVGVVIARARPALSPTVPVPEAAAPELYRLVRDLADRLGVPPPSAIALTPDCDSWLEDRTYEARRARTRRRVRAGAAEQRDALLGRVRLTPSRTSGLGLEASVQAATPGRPSAPGPAAPVLVIGSPFLWWMRVAELRALLAPVVAGTGPAAHPDVAAARRFVRALDAAVALSARDTRPDPDAYADLVAGPYATPGPDGDPSGDDPGGGHPGDELTHDAPPSDARPAAAQRDGLAGPRRSVAPDPVPLADPPAPHPLAVEPQHSDPRDPRPYASDPHAPAHSPPQHDPPRDPLRHDPAAYGARSGRAPWAAEHEREPYATGSVRIAEAAPPAHAPRSDEPAPTVRPTAPRAADRDTPPRHHPAGATNGATPTGTAPAPATSGPAAAGEPREGEYVAREADAAGRAAGRPAPLAALGRGVRRPGLAFVGWVARLLLRACRDNAAEMERGVAAASAQRAQSVDYGLRITAQEQVGLAYAGWDRLLTRVALPAWRMGRWPAQLDAGVVSALTELSRRDRLAEGFASRLGERAACDLLEEPGVADEAISLLAARLFHGGPATPGPDWSPVDWSAYPEEVVDRKWRLEAARLHAVLDTLPRPQAGPAPRAAAAAGTATSGRPPGAALSEDLGPDLGAEATLDRVMDRLSAPDGAPDGPSAIAESLAARLTLALAREEAAQRRSSAAAGAAGLATSGPGTGAAGEPWLDGLAPLFPLQPPRTGRELLADHVTAVVCCAAMDTAGAAPGLDWLDGPTLLVDGRRGTDLSAPVLSLIEDGDPAPLRTWLGDVGVRPDKPIRLV
ncbi:hypothetical protein [Streptomyces sp. NPDC057702]|uniref:hypothetical protein n=1 Tax=unclassified Streptomyces TaxID=2593676 RepID=UPI0036A5384D